jgi:hypothetical protein
MKNIILFLIFMVLLYHVINKKNIECYENTTPLVVFYHIAAIGDWKSIVKEQLQLIKKTKLYDKCTNIYIGFLGNKKEILPFLDNKIKLIYHSVNVKEYEKPTINKLLEFSKNHNLHYVLYIHNKGSTNKLCNNINGQYYWRQLMNYWNIEKHTDNIYYLNKGYLTSGINIRNDHYSGNFWWANSNYIKKLNYINSDDRLAAEFWLLNKKHQVKNKHISLYGPYILSMYCSGLYGMKLNRKDYLNNDIQII